MTNTRHGPRIVRPGVGIVPPGSVRRENSDSGDRLWRQPGTRPSLKHNGKGVEEWCS
jgi:hypothetical protein